MTERKKKEDNLCDLSDYLDYKNIDYAIKFLKDKEKEILNNDHTLYNSPPYTEIKIRYDYNYPYSENKTLLLVGVRDENDAEMKHRLELEHKTLKTQEEYELRQLEALKKKYENK